MAGLQNRTSENEILEVTAQLEPITLLQQKWIDFCAVGGLVVEDDGTLKPIKIGQFAEMIGVARQTLYDWKKSIPAFEDRVKEAQLRIGGGTARRQKVYNGLMLKAAAGDAPAAKLWLQIFDGWKPPQQEVKMDHNFGLADLVAKKKLEADRERKIIDATPSD